MRGVYLICWGEPIGKAQTVEKRRQHGLAPRTKGFTPTARHYIGYADDIERRFDEHCRGIGATITAEAVRQGRTLVLVKVWAGQGRSHERRIKRHKNAPRFCPICTGGWQGETVIIRSSEGDTEDNGDHE